MIMNIEFYFWLYFIIGLGVAVDYIARAEDSFDDIEVPMLLICAIAVLLFWPVRVCVKLQDFVVKKLIK